MSQSAFPYKVINSNWDYTDVGCCQKSVTQPSISPCMLDYADGRDLFKGEHWCKTNYCAEFHKLCNHHPLFLPLFPYLINDCMILVCLPSLGFMSLFVRGILCFSYKVYSVEMSGNEGREREMGKDMQQKSLGSQMLRLMVAALTLRPPGRSPSATTLIINQFLSKSTKHTLVPAS